jgi:asparagine N-glycosylation enzyme membrane subunit Stt3
VRVPFRGTRLASEEGRPDMLTTIIAILVILWLLGMISSYTIGGLIHILLVLAIIAVLVRIIQGRRPI